MPKDPLASTWEGLGYGQPTIAFGEPKEGESPTEQADPLASTWEGLGYGQPTIAFGEPKEEEAPETSDTGRLGQVYGSLTRGITGGVGSQLQSLAVWAYNMERKYPSWFMGDTRGVSFKDWAKGKTGEGGLYRLGESIKGIGESITPTESKKWKDDWLYTDVPSGIGSVGAFLIGTKGVTAPLKMARGGAAGLQARGAAAASAAATAKGMTAKGAERAGRLLGAKAAARETAALQGIGTVTAGVAMETTSGWEEAYGTLSAKAQAEGREMTDSEYDQAWSQYKWAVVSGASEVFGANRVVLTLFKNIDKGSKGAWGAGLRKILKDSRDKSKVRDIGAGAIAGAAEEAAQEAFQTTWMNIGAAQISKYDENRKLFEDVLHAGGVGGVVGGIFGSLISGLNRKAKVHRRIAELTRREKDLRMGGSPEMAKVVRDQLDEAVLELGADADAVAAERAKFEAMAEFQKKEDETEEEHRTRLVDFFTKDYIENEDGTVTIKMDDGWTMTTVEKASREQAAGMTKPETEKYKSEEENAPLVEKVETLSNKVERLVKQREKKLDKNEDVREVEEQIRETTIELEKAEAALKETPTIEVERERFKPTPQAAFRLVSPEGNDFGVMSRVEAEEFVRGQTGERRDVQHYIDEYEGADSWEDKHQVLINLDDRIHDANLDMTGHEDWRDQAWGETLDALDKAGVEAEGQAEVDETTEEYNERVEQEEEKRERKADLDKRKARLGLGQQREFHWGGGEVVDLLTTDPESDKRYEVISYAEREEGMGMPAVGANQVLLKDLDTGEYSAHDSKLVESREEGFEEGRLETDPLVAPKAKAAPRMTPAAVALAKDYGLIAVSESETALQRKIAELRKELGARETQLKRAKTELSTAEEYDLRSREAKEAKERKEKAVAERQEAVDEISSEIDELAEKLKDVYTLTSRIIPADGRTITPKDVRAQALQLRRQREAFDIDRQIKDLLEQQLDRASKATLNAIKNLNSKGNIKQRGGIEMDLGIVLKFREMENAFIESENKEISERVKKQQRAKAERLWDSIQDKLVKQGERKYKKLIKWYQPWQYLHERVKFDPDKADIPPTRRRKRKTPEKAKITTKEVREVDKYLKSLFKRKPPKTAAKVEGRQAQIPEGRANVLEGVANGITYTAYQLDSGRVIVRTGETYDRWLSKSEAEEIVGQAHGVLYIVEYSNGEVFGNNANPIGSATALKAIRDTKENVRLTEVHTEGFVRKEEFMLVTNEKGEKERIKYPHPRPQARTLAHKSIENTTNNIKNLTQLDDGTITRIKPPPAHVGQGLLPASRTDVGTVRKEEDAADRAEIEKETAVLRRAKEGESKVVTPESKGVSAVDREVAEAFRQELIDLVTAGGEFHGLSFAGVKITSTGSASQVAKDKKHKPGDAVYVKASEPNVVYLNPKLLRTYYTVKDGRLKPDTGKEGKKLEEKLKKETSPKKRKEIEKGIENLEAQRRSIKSVAREELIHLLDLQAIRYVLKKNGKVGNIKEVRSYLRGIYNQLSVAQLESILTKYMGLSKTVHNSPRGEAGLSPEQIAMEALRLIRSGDGIYLETEASSKHNKLFFNYFKGVREWVHETLGTTEGAYTDAAGRRRNMPKGIAAHLEMTENFLGISRDAKGKEVIHQILERYDSEETMAFVYVRMTPDSDTHQFPATREGYQDALAYAQRQINKLPPAQRKNNKPENKIRRSNGEVVRAALIGEADKRRNRDFSFRRKMTELYQRMRTIKLTGKDLERIQEMGKRDGYDFSRIDNWGDYAWATSAIEANIVWGVGSGTAMNPYRSYRNDYQEKAFIAQGYSEDEAREKATYSEFPGGTIDTAAADYYMYLFLRKVEAAFEPRYKVKGSTQTFAATPDGKKLARRLAFDKKLKQVKEKEPDKTTLTPAERGEAYKDVTLKKPIEHEGEGRTGLNIVPKEETKAEAEAPSKKKRASLRMEYATAFLKHYTAQKRSAGKRAEGLGVDEDGTYSADQWEKDVANLTESMYEDFRANPNEQARAVEELITYESVIGSIMDSSEKVDQEKFDSKKEAEAYQKKGMPWITKPEITEETEYEFGVDPDGQPYKPLLLVSEAVEIEDDLEFVKTEEYTTPEGEVRERNVYRKTGTLRSDVLVKEEVSLGRLVEGEPDSTTKYIVSGGSIQRNVPKELELTELESRVVYGIVNEDGAGARTMLELAREFEKEAAADPDGFIAKMIGEGEIIASKDGRISLWKLNEINSKAMEKVRKINTGWRGATDGDMTFGANLDESPDSAAHILRTNEGSDSTTGESPVADIGERNKSKWWRPGDWSATDKLRSLGLESLADKIDTFYNTESEILGSVMRGRRVLQRGGVELVGVDEQGNDRSAFFHTEQEALAHAAENEWNVKYTRAVKGYGKKGMRRAEAFANEYNSLRESGREDIAEYFLKHKAPKAAKDLIAWQKDTGLETGKMLRKYRVKVSSGDGWKLIDDLAEKHFPRVFKQEVWEIIENPSRNPEKYDKLLTAVIDYGTAPNKEGAHRVLQNMMSNVSDVTEGAERNDFFANMEKARGFRLPNEFYDTSMDAYNTFLRRFSTRMAQIVAFGQGRGGKNKTAWDALIESPNLSKKVKDYIGKVYKSVYRSYSKDDGVVAMLNRTGLPVTAVAYLSGPLTAIRNTTFALRANAEHFGGWATLGASFKGLVSVIKTNANTLKTRGELGMDLESAQAESLGAMRSDFLEAKEYAFDEDVRVGWEHSYKKAATPVIKIALLMQRTTEQFNRSITATMAKQHLRTTRKLLDRKPDGEEAAKHVALITRMGYSPEQVKKLFEKDKDGHWVDNSRAVRDFIRDMVNERQYGYNLRQHPVFMDAPSSRILLQFQKWGFQRTRDFARNVWRPFFKGTDVTMPDGTVKNVRDGKPLAMSLFLTIAQGELYATILRGLFYDRERDELVVPLSEKTDSALGGLSDRLVFDVVYDGGLGIVTDYIALLNPADTRPRKWKDFMSPPSLDLVEDTATMVKDIKHIIWEETGLNAKKDAVLGAIERQIMRFPLTKAFGFPFVEHGGLAHNLRRRLGAEDYTMRVQDAEKDVRLVRAAARKFAKANGYEEDRVWSGGVPVHTEKRELYGQLNEALLGGDEARAIQVRDKLIAGKKGKERKAVLTAIKASVRGKQPILLEGRQPTDKVRREFLRWVKTELPGYEERIRQVNKEYWQAARRAGVK